MYTHRIGVGLLCVAVSACSSLRGVETQASKAPPVAATTGQAPPFETVIQGAEKLPGLLPIWRKQDKLWLELSNKDLQRRAFFLSPQLTAGIGEQGLFGGLLISRWNDIGRPQWVEFRKVNQQVQLLAVNGAFTAAQGSPTAWGVDAAFSKSLLASAPIASSEHPQRGTVLVDLSAMMLADITGLGSQLQRAFKQSYSLDTRQSSVSHVPASAQAIVLQVQHHFVAANLASPSSGDGGELSASPRMPSGLPDPRSLFITVRYTLSALPEQPMLPRKADQRVGFFTSTVSDFTNDLNRSPKQRFINRWVLERKEPAAPRSAPVRPLVFWLDESIPKAYRPAIRAGVLEWNKAFDAIGFENALQVEEDPAKQPVDTVGNGHIIIRWMTNHDPRFGAIGPSHVDPRSGEILAGAIAFESLSSRSLRALRSQVLGSSASPALPDRCDHALLAAEQLDYGLDALSAQMAGGELPPDSEEAQAFVLAYLKETTMHEVGHVLGLRHNFKASRWHTQGQLQQAELTRVEGNSASVMDYPAINLGPPGEPWGTPFQTTLGPYDYWAIEYGYKPLAGNEAEQAQALRAIADRQSQPQWQIPLDYGTDEDQSLGLDPQALMFDLGRNPLTFATHRVQLAKHLLDKYSHMPSSQSGEDPAKMRRRVLYALRDMGRAANVVLRQVGGLMTRRDAPDSGRALLAPLPAQEQRAALTWLLETFFADDILALPPAFQRRLAPDYFERTDAPTSNDSDTAVTTDFSVTEQWGRLYQGVLDGLMSDKLAAHMLDNIDKTRDLERQPLTWHEMQQRLQTRVWQSKRYATGETPVWLRNLQRSHVNHLSTALLHGGTRADVRAEYRTQALALLRWLRRTAHHRLSASDSAHRQDCIGTLSRALEATVVRQTP